MHPWALVVAAAGRMTQCLNENLATDPMANAESEYEEIIEEYGEEVLIEGVPEPLLTFPLTCSRTKASPGA